MTAVSLKCALPARPSMAPVEVELNKASDGSWTGAGLDFSVAGRWQVGVSIQEEAKGTVVPLELTVPAAASP